MRKYLLLIGVLISMAIQVSASRCGAETPIMDSVESEVASTSLAGVLANIVDNHDNRAEGDSYIVYDASSDEYLTLSAEEYALACAFASVLVHEDVASAGGEWIRCSSGKGASAAREIAMAIARDLQKDRDYQVHVEFATEGSFTVLYRYM